MEAKAAAEVAEAEAAWAKAKAKGRRRRRRRRPGWGVSGPHRGNRPAGRGQETGTEVRDRRRA